MVKVQGLASLAISMFVSAAFGSVAIAQPAPAPAPVPALVGVTELVKLTTRAGFIDDVVATDAQRIAYVVADTGSKAELHVYVHATKQEQIVDIAPITLRPVELALVGNRALVIGQQEDGRRIAALVELAAVGKKPAGSIVYKVGPANGLTVITRDGKPRIAVHKVTTTGDLSRHEVELLALETGKRVAAARPFELDGTGKHAKLELRVNHWSDGMTRAHGIKAGEWDRKEDQRAPDVEATYDLVTGKVTEKRKIEDLFEQRRRYQALAEVRTQLDFLRMAWDNASIQVWRAGKPRSIELDQPLTDYDPKSLQGIVLADGSAWIALKVDPVNAAAVARKKADPEYLDIFRVGTDSRAIRKARVLSTGIRHRFGVVGEKLWLLERSTGFDRGGKSLAVYQL